MRQLTANEIYRTLGDRFEDPEFDRTVVKLIQETLMPVTQTLRARLLAFPKENLIHIAHRFEPDCEVHDVSDGGEPIARALGFDSAYLGSITWPCRMNHSGPFTARNRAVMARLTRATAILSHLIARWRDELTEDQTLRNGAEVLRHHSASHDDIIAIFWLANDSMLQSAAQLTASPVGGLSAEDLLERIVARQDHRPSLLNAFSLALPPNLLGPNGDFYYVKNPLRLEGDRLVFTDHFRGFMKTGRARFKTTYPRDWEFGRGCPVGHADPGCTTGLDLYTDSVMTIYRALEQ